MPVGVHSAMTPEDLVEIEAIKRLKYKYLRCLDQKRWDELATCFTGDARASYGGGAHRLEGSSSIVAWLRQVMGAETFLSSHRVHHPEIDLLTATTGAGTWALEDTVVLTDVEVTVRGAAFYTDEYVKRDGTWVLQSTEYRRTYEEIQSRVGVPGLRLTASWWGTGGRSELQA